MHIPRRCTSVRYQSSLCRRTYLAVVHRRDTSLRYIQTHIPRRCTSMRYQSSLCRRTYLAVVHRRDTSLRLIYTDTYTSPLYIGEISVFLIYRRTYLAVVYRRDTSLRYIQTHIPRRCTSARRWFYITC